MVERVGARADLDEVSGGAVDADVTQLQTDDVVGLGDDEGGAGQLWLGRSEREVSISGQHIQAPWTHTHTHNGTVTFSK